MGASRTDLSARARRRAQRGVGAAALGLALLATSCVGIDVSGTIPAPAAPTATGSFLAGAAREDLTPLAGTPMAGYWIFGKVARGLWTRLYARAIYLEDADGQPLALVSCDLNMIPNGLADRVAELVRADDDLSHVGRERIVLAATHTHHGPGNLFTPAMYNEYGSPRSRFDEELFEWVAARIAQAIHEAWRLRQPAELRVDGAEVDGVFRNRSLPAFLLNPEAGEVLAQNVGLAPCALGPPLVDPRACQAVDPLVHVLHVSHSGDADNVIALGVFAATHPTVLSPQTEVFSGDLHGAVAALLEHGATKARVGSNLPPACARAHPVVAVFNGAEGDVQPDLERRDRAELMRLAGTVARAVCEKLPSMEAGGALDDPRIAVAFERASMKSGCVKDGDGFEHCTEEYPALGIPELGGADDGRTILHDVGLVEERRYYARGEHGVKWQPGKMEIGWFRVNLLRGSVEAPEQAPLGVYRIGNASESVALVGLPGEFTVMMGRRVRERVAAAMSPTPARTIGVGLGSGFVSYVTTPEEYDRQHYEGATTYWGAAAGPWLADRAGQLAGSLSGGSSAPQAWSYEHDAGPGHRFGPREAWGSPYALDDGLWELAFDPALERPRRDHPAYCWYDTLPRLAKVGGACRSAVPAVEIRKDGSTEPLVLDGVPQTNDRGLDLVTVMVGASRVRTEWCAVWLVPPGAETELDAGDEVRFHVTPMLAGAPEQQSALFAPHAVPPIGSGSAVGTRAGSAALPADEGPLLCELTDCSCQ